MQSLVSGTGIDLGQAPSACLSLKPNAGGTLRCDAHMTRPSMVVAKSRKEANLQKQLVVTFNLVSSTSSFHRVWTGERQPLSACFSSFHARRKFAVDDAR